MKKKTLLIICILLFTVGIFILFKAAVWGVYKSSISDIDNLEEIMDRYRNSEEIKIVSKNVSDYLEFDGYKIGNYFIDFVYDGSVEIDWSSIYYQYNGDEKVGMFSAGTFNSLVDAASKDKISFFELDDEEGISFSEIFYSGFSDYIEENNIKDDADLIKAWSEYNFEKEYGVFTPLKTLREDFSIKLVCSVTLPATDKIYYLDGDMKGYILEINSLKNNRNYYEINIFKNDKRYIFSVLSSNYSIEDIKEITSTIVIEK